MNHQPTIRTNVREIDRLLGRIGRDAITVVGLVLATAMLAVVWLTRGLFFVRGHE